MTKNLKDVLQNSVLCFGDVMMDIFITGSVDRVSPEGPIPILCHANERKIPGGAGNVARNIASLGGQCHLVGTYGDDDNGKTLQTLLDQDGIKFYGVCDSLRPTASKTRFISSGQQLLRYDYEKTHAILPEQEQLLYTLLSSFKNQEKILILSDYGKGVLTNPMLEMVIKLAKSHNMIVIVDPKGTDFSKYKGVDYITPNRDELYKATGMAVESDAQIEAACKKITTQCNIKGVLATRSEQGASLFENGKITHFPSNAKDVYNVVGAGDTVIAVFGLALAGGFDSVASANLANHAGSIAVSKPDTATVTLQELEGRNAFVAYPTKLFDMQALDQKLVQWRASKERIVFTNGCFDLLHAGHLSLLYGALKHGDKLLVGLNSDCSVKKLKGAERPIQTETVRAQLLSALEMVDGVVLFDEETPEKLIHRIVPDVLVKGGDYSYEDVVGGDFVENNAGKVILIDLLEGYSTTSLVHKMQGLDAS